VATGQVGLEPSICVWDSKDQQVKALFKGIIKKGVSQVCFSNNGKLVAGIGLDEDHCLAIYDLEKAKSLREDPGKI
jgi:hypothetical protein